MRLSSGAAHNHGPLAGRPIIVPKHRKRRFYGSLRSEIGQILRQLCRQKDIELVKGNALPDHVHLLLSVPPKYSIANTVGFLKGKSAIRINRDLGKVKGSLYGRAFWSRGYAIAKACSSRARPAWARAIWQLPWGCER